MMKIKSSKNQQGFSLIEIMIVIAVLGGLSLVIINLNKQATVSQKKFQTDIDADFISKEISGILADPIKCGSIDVNKKGLVGFNVNSGEMKDLKIYGQYLAAKNKKYGISQVEILSYEISNSLSYSEISDQEAEAMLIIKFATPKIVSSKVSLIKPRRIKLLITKDGAGTIVSCRSAWTNQSDYWVKTDPIVVPGDNIF